MFRPAVASPGAWLLLCACIVVPVRAADASPGDLDATFGVSGLAQTSATFNFSIAALVRQADGKLIAAGSATEPFYNGNEFQLARFEIDGSPDLSFGNLGVDSTVISSSSVAVQVLKQQSDGKLVIAGIVGPPQQAIGLARDNADGTFDATFGRQGVVVDGNLPVLALAALLFQPDGKIIVVSGGAGTLTGSREPVQLGRYNADGSIDRTFPAGGGPAAPAPTTPPTEFPTAAFLQPDGRIVVAVRTLSGDPALVRYDAQGAVDVAFGTTGVLTLGHGDGCCDMPPTDIVQLPDGRLAVAVIEFDSNETGLRPTYRIYAVTPDGAIDTTFGSGGFVSIAYGDYLAAGHLFPWQGTTSHLAVEPDGKLLQIGVVYAAAHLTPLVVRYDLHGVRDSTFGAGGVMVGPATDLELQPQALVLQPDGKLLIGGPGFLARFVLGGVAMNTAVEYYNAEFGDYFVTSIPDEVDALDSAAIGGWQRTGQYFPVFSSTDGAAVPMCRFFSGAAFAPMSTHFLTPYPSECAKLKSDSAWTFEGAVLPVRLPDAQGTCAIGTFPVYRLFNAAQAGAPVHRYTTSTTIRMQAIEAGWEAEGRGPFAVTACVPMNLQ